MKAKILTVCVVLTVVMSMLCNLNAAAMSLQESRNRIRERLEIVEGLQQDNYTPKTWENLQKVVEEVRPFVDQGTNEEETEAKWVLLGDTIAKLRMVPDREVLEAAISITGFLDQSEYTQASWNNLLSAMSEAKTVKADVNADQARVDLAQKRLTTAVSRLVKLNGDKCPDYKNASKDIDKTILHATLYNLSLYKQEFFDSTSYTIYQYTVSVAREMLESADATQLQINSIQSDVVLGMYYMQTEPQQLSLLAKELLKLPAALRPEPPKEVVDSGNKAPDTGKNPFRPVVTPGGDDVSSELESEPDNAEQTSSERRVTKKKVIITKPGQPADYTWLWILIGVGSGVLAIGAAIVIIILVRRKKKENLEA